MFRLNAAGLAIYLVSAVGAWLVWRRIDIAAHRKRLALQLWGWQLMANAIWPSLLFGLRSTTAGLGAAALSAAAVAATVGTFWPLGRGAALLLLPRLAWTVFASYLLFRVWSLNPV